MYASVVDAGKSVIYGGGRTRPDLGRLGINNGLTLYAEDQIIRLFPVPVPKRRIFTAYWNKTSKSRVGQKSDMFRLHVKRVSKLFGNF